MKDWLRHNLPIPLTVILSSFTRILHPQHQEVHCHGLLGFGMNASGQNPNVFFQAAAVRLCDIPSDRFIALPRREAVRLADASGYKYIAEGSPDWRALHRSGRLTSSRLGGLLNLWAPPNSKVLGFKSTPNQGLERLLDAYTQLTGPPVNLIEGGDVAEARRQNVRAHLDAGGVSTTGSDVDADRAGAAQTQGLVEEMKVGKARLLQGQGSLMHVRLAWGSAQEASTIQTLCERFGDSRFFMEVGMMEPDADTLKRYGFEAGGLPPLGSTPDCICVASAASREQAVEAFADMSATESRIQVVEVKNTTPFRLSRRKKMFEISDSGPRQRVDAVWVVQLQFHLLCSGADSAWLVSRSATKGTNVFEMERDDEYIQMLLTCVNVFYERYCVPGKRPPKNALSDVKEHRQLLLKTRQLALRAALFDHVPHQPLEGADLRGFLPV